MADNSSLPISGKKPLSEFPDIPLSIFRLPTDPEFPSIENYLCNYVDSIEQTTLTLVPNTPTFNMFWKGKPRTLHQLASMHKFSYIRSEVETDWFSELIAFLEHNNFDIPNYKEESSFKTHKRPRKLSPTHTPSSITTSNRFEILSQTNSPMEVPLNNSSETEITPPPTSSTPRPMAFKSKPPPISIQLTSDTVLPLIKSIIHKDTNITYRPKRISIQASSIEEYKSILSTASTHNLEFFTHNPVVSNVSKTVLRGLPANTSSEDIQAEFTALNIEISDVRQMIKYTTSSDGSRTKIPMPLWVITHHRDVKSYITALTSLFNFRIKFEDLKSRNPAFQCYRCQEFGHRADFCKLTFQCNLCAANHDSRTCPTRSLPTRKCSNCSGDHPASSRDCPARLQYIASLRRPSSKPLPPTPSDFPPLRTLTPTRQPTQSNSSTLQELLQLLSSPNLQELLQTITSLIRNLLSNPQLLTNLNLLLSAFPK